MSREARPLSDFAELVSGSGAPVLVGGQAVNLWSLIAAHSDSGIGAELGQFKPFTSKDCDVLGDRNLLRSLGARARLQVREFEFGQASFCIGYLYAAADPRRDPVVEVLSGIRGLPPGEMGEPAEVEFDRATYRVLNPVDLLRSKLTNAVEIAQEGRQDVRHIRMLVPCARWYIACAHDKARDGTSEDWKVVTKLLRKCIEVVDSPVRQTGWKRAWH